MIYVLVDGKWHVPTGDFGETTVCGLTVPFGNEWTRDVPEKVCGKCVPPKKAASDG